jgi:phage-related protein
VAGVRTLQNQGLAFAADAPYEGWMRWSVELLNESVVEELNDLPLDLRARLTRLIDLIGELGLERLREPDVKHLEGKLWELRVKGRTGIARAVYVTARSRRLVILHVFQKKTQRTPRRAIRLALARAKEVT